MLSLDTYTFSSALPESFTIEADQDEDHVEVDICKLLTPRGSMQIVPGYARSMNCAPSWSNT